MKLKDILNELTGFKYVEPVIQGRPNQYIIYFENGKVFQSYNSIIVVKVYDRVYLTSKYDISNTTGKFRNLFLNESINETRAKIKSGEYTLLK